MATESNEGGGHVNPLAGLRLIRLADVERESVSWRWSGRLPEGKLVIEEGDPGTGKSWLSMAIATAVTVGAPLPGDTEQFEPQNVLIFTAEDGLADTVRPRLEDMGADLSRVVAVDAVVDADGAERFPNLADDLFFIDAELAKGGYGLVVFDPLNAYLKGVDGNRDIDLRSVLGPLAALAERYDVTVICIRHLTKSSRDRAIYRGQGNIAYVAAARVVLLVGVNPDDESERVVIPIKNNLAPLAAPVAFEVVDGQFRWRGATDVTAAQLLAPDTPAEERSARDEAAEFLKEALADGPRSQPEVIGESRSLGIKERTLRRAKQDLGIVSTPRYEPGRRGAAGHDWHLPDDSTDLDGHAPIHGERGHLNHFEVEAAPAGDAVGHLNPLDDLVGEEEVF
jgi:hypothetical protein